MPTQLTIYVQRGCPYSEEALAWLTGRGISHLERDISSDPNALHDLEFLETIVTPTILVDNEIVYGFDEERLLSLLNCRQTKVNSPDVTATSGELTSSVGQPNVSLCLE